MYGSHARSLSANEVNPQSSLHCAQMPEDLSLDSIGESAFRNHEYLYPLACAGTVLFAAVGAVSGAKTLLYEVFGSRTEGHIIEDRGTDKRVLFNSEKGDIVMGTGRLFSIFCGGMREGDAVSILYLRKQPTAAIINHWSELFLKPLTSLATAFVFATVAVFMNENTWAALMPML